MDSAWRLIDFASSISLKTLPVVGLALCVLLAVACYVRRNLMAWCIVALWATGPALISTSLIFISLTRTLGATAAARGLLDIVGFYLPLGVLLLVSSFSTGWALVARWHAMPRPTSQRECYVALTLVAVLYVSLQPSLGKKIPDHCLNCK